MREWTNQQIVTMRRINRILWKMLFSNNEDEVFDLFCEADDLWNEYFPWEAAQKGDKWKGVRWFNDKMRSLKKPQIIEVAVNINNSNVNIVYGDFIEDVTKKNN